MRSFFLVLLAVSACSAAGSDINDDIVVNPDLVKVELPYDAEEDGFAPCGMQVDPDPELYDFVFEAQERWFSATGCMIEIDSDGIPLHALNHVYVDELSNIYDVNPQLEYKQVCGATRRNNDGSSKDIHVSRTDWGGCNLEEDVLHELGHVWGPPGQHAESGAMAGGKDPDQSPVINENTLAWTCQKLDCQTFNPEPEPVRQCQTILGSGESFWGPCP